MVKGLREMAKNKQSALRGIQPHSDDEERRQVYNSERNRQRRRRDSTESSDEAPRQRRRISPQSDDEVNPDGDSTMLDQSEDSQATFIKKLVRYALSCEYARLPIRREGIKEKVFGKHSGRKFAAVFEGAQRVLRERFGMMMEELPLKEKISLRDRRAAAQRGADATKGSSSYVLVSVLPKSMKVPEIIVPGLQPSERDEASYVGLYSFVIACIALSGGTISNEKLLRNLRRLNAEENTPLDTTENVLAKMQRQGYVLKIKDSTGGDEVVNWMVGPRGKIEVGDQGVRGMVSEVYGETAPEDLKSRLAVSLGTREVVVEQDEEEEVVVAVVDEMEAEQLAPRRGGRMRA